MNFNQERAKAQRGIAGDKFYRLCYGIIMLVPFLLLSCAFTPRQPEPPPRPLTKKERSVKIKSGNQATTLQLNEKCKPKNGIKTFYGSKYGVRKGIDPEVVEYDIRVHTASIDANVAQIIYAPRHNNVITSYEVRFWLCPK